MGMGRVIRDSNVLGQVRLHGHLTTLPRTIYQANVECVLTLVSCSVEVPRVVIEGKVSSKLQVTIPARVRDALGIEPATRSATNSRAGACA